MKTIADLIPPGTKLWHAEYQPPARTLIGQSEMTRALAAPARAAEYMPRPWSDPEFDPADFSLEG